MKITLMIDDKEKTFVAPFISARRMKDTIKLSNKLQDNFTEELIDELCNYLVKIYGNQFTIDDVLDGMESNDFIKKAVKDMQTVMGNFDDEVKN